MDYLKLHNKTPDANDFRIICRICLEKKQNMQSIYNCNKTDECFKDDIHEKLKSLSGIRVKQNDRLPQHICIECMNFLFTAYYFKKLCRESDSKLRSVLIESESDGIDDNFEYEDACKTNEIKRQKTFNKTKEYEDPLKTFEVKKESNEEPRFDEFELENDEINQIFVHSSIMSVKDLMSFDENDSNNVSDRDLSEKFPANRIKVLSLKDNSTVKKKKSKIIVRKILVNKNNKKDIPLTDNTLVYKKNDVNIDDIKDALAANKRVLLLNKSDLVKQKKRGMKTKSSKKKNAVVKIKRKKMLPAEKNLSSNECLGYLECLFCNVKYNDKDLLYEHLACEHKDMRGFKCFACDLTFNSVTEKSEHDQHHCPNEQRESNFECRTCSITFEDRSSYKSHMMKHNGGLDAGIVELDSLLKCEHCSYITHKKNRLTTHIRERHSSRMLLCKICGESFKTTNLMWQHKLSSHLGPPVKKFKCSYCEFKTDNSMTLRQHERRHTETEHEFMCEECGKTFITSCALKKHLIGHTGKRDYQCDLCEKNYAIKSQLKSHIEAIHIKIRPFKCTMEHCPAAFYQRSKCIKHLRQVHKITSNFNVPYRKEIRRQLKENAT